MSDVLTSSTGLVLAALFITAAIAMAGWVVFAPQFRRVPRSRRRPERASAGTPWLAGAAEASSALMERLLGANASPLAEKLTLAGLRLAPRDFAVVSSSGLFVFFALGLVTGGPLSAVLFLLLGAGMVWLTLGILTDRRRKAFAEQLDQALQMLAASMRAGYSLTQAITAVAAESEDPVREEFSRVLNESRVGRPLAQSLEDSALRMKNDDFYWIGQAIAINRQVGGSLADVLDGVATTIRERGAMRRQVATLSAEGRISAVVLMVLPVGVGLMLSLLNPKYIGLLLVHPLGWVMLGTSVLLLTVGGLWLRATVRVKF